MSPLTESVSKETLLKLRTCPISGLDLFGQLLLYTVREIKENRSDEFGRPLELAVVPHVNKQEIAGRGRNLDGPPCKVPKVNRPFIFIKLYFQFGSDNGAPAANCNTVPGLLLL